MSKLLMECAVRVDAALPPPIAQTDLDAIDVHVPPPPPPPPPSADAPSTRKRELDDVLDTLETGMEQIAASMRTGHVNGRFEKMDKTVYRRVCESKGV